MILQFTGVTKVGDNMIENLDHGCDLQSDLRQGRRCLSALWQNEVDRPVTKAIHV